MNVNCHSMNLLYNIENHVFFCFSCRLRRVRKNSMASDSWAQDVITCDLCDKPTQQFCNSCQVSLCYTCLKKHRETFLSLSHDIVPFKNKSYQLVFPECKTHTGHRCEAYCQMCDTPICTKCFIGSHKGHDAE